MLINPPWLPIPGETDDHDDDVEERNTDKGDHDQDGVGDQGRAGERNVVKDHVVVSL